MSERIGDFMLTYGGNPFWPLDPRPEDISILDIAHSLSNQCRFTGHCQKFYSVAEHSIYVSQRVPEELALAGLLHDASEAYLSDICRPLKRSGDFAKNYLEAEHRLEEVIAKVYNLPFPMHPLIKNADNSMLALEIKQIMKVNHQVELVEEDKGIVYDFLLSCWNPQKAKLKFLDEFQRIVKRRIHADTRER